MRKRTIWIVGVFAMMLMAASAVALADLDGGGQNQDLNANNNPNIIRDGPGDCYCPANWAPVACRNGDGGKALFSNSCVAGCNGYTHCTPIEEPQLSTR